MLNGSAPAPIEYVITPSDPTSESVAFTSTMVGLPVGLTVSDISSSISPWLNVGVNSFSSNRLTIRLVMSLRSEIISVQRKLTV